MVSSYRDPKFVVQILLADFGALFRRTALVRNVVEFDDRPSTELHLMQRFEDSRQINLPASKFDELIILLRIAQFLDIFNMQEQQSIGIFVDGFDRIASALEIVSDVEFELRVTWIGRCQNLIYFFGSLSKRAHVIVIAERNPEVRCLLSKCGQQLPESLVVFWGDRAIL